MDFRKNTAAKQVQNCAVWLSALTPTMQRFGIWD
jgi:hypothetical protein